MSQGENAAPADPAPPTTHSSTPFPTGTVSAPSLEPASDHSSTSSSAGDSAIASWQSSRMQSLTPSATDFPYVHGRRYHGYREGEYMLPNDETEQDRLDMQHAIFRYSLDGKLITAPIEPAQLHDVLDVGCGTGLWAIDVADEHPQAQVLGFDLRCVACAARDEHPTD
jgi:16S rRNA G1207 methylase RsmC